MAPFEMSTKRAAEILEELRGILSSPGLSAADVYEEVSLVLGREGYPVYDYEDESNPYNDGGPGEGQ